MCLPHRIVEKVIKSFSENLSVPVEGSELYREATSENLTQYLFPCDRAYIRVNDELDNQE